LEELIETINMITPENMKMNGIKPTIHLEPTGGEDDIMKVLNDMNEELSGGLTESIEKLEENYKQEMEIAKPQETTYVNYEKSSVSNKREYGNVRRIENNIALAVGWE